MDTYVFDCSADALRNVLQYENDKTQLNFLAVWVESDNDSSNIFGDWMTAAHSLPSLNASALVIDLIVHLINQGHMNLEGVKALSDGVATVLEKYTTESAMEVD